MKKLLIPLFCFTLAGCEMMRPFPAQPEPRWYKQGTTQEQARVKHAKCVYDVGMNKVAKTDEYTLVTNCMIADGFTWGVPPELKDKWQKEVDALQKQGYTLY